jgi:hypothetical protein
MPPAPTVQRAWRRLCLALLVAAAFYGGFRAGVLVAGLQAQGGPFEQPGRGGGDIVQTVRYVPETQCDARIVLDTRCLPLAPATQVPVTPAPVAQVSVVQIRRRKPAPLPKRAARETPAQDEAHIGLQR